MLKRIMVLLTALILLASVSYAETGNVVFAFENYHYEVNKEKTVKLKPILQGAELPKEPKYVWESDNPTVATVRRGTVNGISAGEANIRCTLTLNDTEYTATCMVSVLQPVTSIKFDEKDWKMMEGQTLKFEPEVLPENANNKELHFSSSNSNIATIDSKGVITAKDRGTCMIIAEATDGSGKKLEKKLTVVTFLMDMDEFVLTERKTYTLELPKVEYPNNINVYYLRMDGKGCFDVGNIYIDRTYGPVIGTYGDANTLKINPVSTGTGTITVMDDNAYFGNSGPKSSHEIKIRVEPSATYCEESFPRVNFDDVTRDAMALVGRPVSVKGTIVNIEQLPYGNSLKQYRYTVETNDENKNHVFLLMPVRVGTSPVKIAVKNEKGSKSDPESKDGKFIVGDRVTVYGEYTEPVVYETETGLSMTTPQIMVEMINGDCYNKELKSLVVKDLTDR